jgi:hypothetical protein
VIWLLIAAVLCWIILRWSADERKRQDDERQRVQEAKRSAWREE